MRRRGRCALCYEFSSLQTYRTTTKKAEQGPEREKEGESVCATKSIQSHQPPPASPSAIERATADLLRHKSHRSPPISAAAASITATSTVTAISTVATRLQQDLRDSSHDCRLADARRTREDDERVSDGRRRQRLLRRVWGGCGGPRDCEYGCRLVGGSWGRGMGGGRGFEGDASARGKCSNAAV